MAPENWAQYTRALRRERKQLEESLNDAPSQSAFDAVSAAMLVLTALECAAETMAGGAVYD